MKKNIEKVTREIYKLISLKEVDKVRKNKIPKINTINYGGKWIGLGLLIAVVIPGVIWLLFHVFLWWLCGAGAAILVAFLVVFLIEMWQDNRKIPYYERTLKEKIPYD